MFRQLGLGGALLAVFVLAGGHWMTLQTVAKATMLYTYTQRSGSLTVGAAETFDGEHPCELCRQIAAAKSAQHQDGPGQSEMKRAAPVKAVLAGPALRLSAYFGARLALLADDPLPGSCPAQAPPTPPPRTAGRHAA